jgi:hypothetical protein
MVPFLRVIVYAFPQRDNLRLDPSIGRCQRQQFLAPFLGKSMWARSESSIQFAHGGRKVRSPIPDHETAFDFLKYEVVATTIVELLRENRQPRHWYPEAPIHRRRAGQREGRVTHTRSCMCFRVSLCAIRV